MKSTASRKALARALAARCAALRAPFDAGATDPPPTSRGGAVGSPDMLEAAAERQVFEEFVASDAAGETDLAELYQDFVAAFAPQRRRSLGVYYTPDAVVHAQVRLVGDLLEQRLGVPAAFNDERVVIVDPATGSGAYPVAVAEYATAAAGSLIGARQSAGLAKAAGMQGSAGTLGARMRVFEPLPGAAIIARARLAALLGPAAGLSVEETDILAARRRIDDAPILVCLGNPPYNRQWLPQRSAVARKGGWVRFGSGAQSPPILGDFFDPQTSAGRHAKNLYNDYVYFWRWGVWAVLEQRGGPGIVSFVTASSYLRGPGFAGMRRHLRRELDDLWIVDLEGDRLAARRTANVFPIRTPVAIAMGVRYASSQPTLPATVHYVRLVGSQPAKLAALEAVNRLRDLPWQTASDGSGEWSGPFVAMPHGPTDYASWPRLTDMFPLQLSGAQLKRTWPIAPTPEVLRERWQRFLDLPSATVDGRAAAFRETRDRSLDSHPNDLCDPGRRLEPLRTLAPGAPCLEPVPYAYRSFDRQWVLPDARLGDFMRPTLWRIAGPSQLFLTSLLTNVPGPGPVVVATALVPDLDHFRGSFGGRAILPLWKDPEARCPNVAAGLLEWLSSRYEHVVSPQRWLAYCYALLGTRGYAVRFEDELRTPGPRVPLTADPRLFGRAADAGAELLWLHTFGQRSVPPYEPLGRLAPGPARCLVAIGADYPGAFGYDAARRTLQVGAGSFGPVSPAAWSYGVSGMRVIPGWLGRRITPRRPTRTSSVLDAVVPRGWSTTLTDELLDVVGVVEATLLLEPRLDALLDEITSGSCWQVPATGMLQQEVLDGSAG